MPADFDPRPEQIKALEKQREEMTAKYQAMVTEINSRISKLPGAAPFTARASRAGRRSV